jgi:hypothetical protein
MTGRHDSECLLQARQLWLSWHALVGLQSRRAPAAHGSPSGARAARRRYLAEVPDAFAARVQAALPFLLAARGGAGARFLAPALLQATGAPGAATADEAAEHAAWMQALGRPQARSPMTAPVNASLTKCGLSLHVLPRLLRRFHAAGRPGWDSQLNRCSLRVG